MSLGHSTGLLGVIRRDRLLSPLAWAGHTLGAQPLALGGQLASPVWMFQVVVSPWGGQARQRTTGAQTGGPCPIHWLPRARGYLAELLAAQEAWLWAQGWTAWASSCPR